MRKSYRKRRIKEPPRFNNFKPSGVPRRYLAKVELSLDEFEAIRLADYLHLEHLEASGRMTISRPTFTRLIEKARGKISEALIEGKEIVIEGGNIDFINTLHLCNDCGEVTPEPYSEENRNCPDCGSGNVDNLGLNYLERGRHRHGRRGREKHG